MEFENSSETFRRLIEAMEPTKRHLDLMDFDSAFRSLNKSLVSAGAFSTAIEIAKAAKRSMGQYELSEALKDTAPLMSILEARAAIPSNQIAAMMKTLDSSTLAASQMQALAQQSVSEFGEIISNVTPFLSSAESLIGVGKGFAELTLPTDRFVDLAAQLQIELGLMADDLEGGIEAEGEDEPLILVPEDIRGLLIEVHALPVRIMAQLRKYPRQVLTQLSPEQFEEFVANLCEELGGTDVTILGPVNRGDHGIDVLVHFIVEEIKTLFGIQCKKYRPGRKVEGKEVRELCGSLALSPYGAERGILCTSSDFRPQAQNYFLQDVTLDGWNADDLAELVLDLR